MSKKYRETRRKAGLCVECDAESVPGQRRCPTHKAEQRERNKAYYAQHRDETKAEYARLVAAEICPACKQANKSAESVYCLTCLEKQRERQKAAAIVTAKEKSAATKEQRSAWRRAGLCLSCGSDQFKAQRCRRCYALWLEQSKNYTRHDSRKYAGLCISCDAVVPDGNVRCPTCRGIRNDERAARIKIGVCVDHPDRDVVTGRQRCQKCLDSAKARRAANTAAGLCAECGNESPEPNGQLGKICLERGRIKDKRKRIRLRRLAQSKYGEILQCFCCHEGNPDFLELDHIAGDGAAHRRSIGGKQRIGGSRMLYWLKKHNFPPGLQLACGTCNKAKHRHGVCPHQNLPPDLLQALQEVNERIAAAVHRAADDLP